MRLAKLVSVVAGSLGRRKDVVAPAGVSRDAIMASRERREDGGRLFGGDGSTAVRRPFGHARVIPPHIPAASARHNHGTVFIFDCDGDLRRDPDRRGTRGANVLPFRSPVTLERRP